MDNSPGLDSVILDFSRCPIVGLSADCGSRLGPGGDRLELRSLFVE